MAIRRILTAIVAVLAVLVAVRALAGTSSSPRLALGTDVHDAARLIAREQVLADVASEPSLRTQHFIIKYPQGDAADAGIVAGQVERAYSFVFGQLGGAPAQPVVIRLESRAALASDLSVAPSQDPLGAYWRGVVWLLTPSAYLPGNLAQRTAAFAAVGPVAHELTHLADDDLTGGRMPPFLDEGMAQYMQWRFNGYLWLEPDNTFCQPLYSFADLADDFDNLPNQALAYHESFAIVRDIAAASRQGASRLLSAIAAGDSAQAAIAQAAGTRESALLAGGGAWSCSSAGASQAATLNPGPSPTNASGGNGS
jgi:hypothetical protein